MKKVKFPRQAGLRAAVTAMFRGRPFLAGFGKDIQQLALAALIGAAAAFFPFTGTWHPWAGAALLVTAVVSYLVGAILVFKNGG